MFGMLPEPSDHRAPSFPAARQGLTSDFAVDRSLASSATFEDASPIDGQVLAHIARGGAAEAEAAVRAAAKAFPAWARTTWSGRSIQ